MANYVYNYLFCSSEAKDKLFSLDYEYVYEIHRAYSETIIEVDNNRYLVIFSTRGTEYHRNFIENFITEFKGTEWYCIEGNEIEQGHFWWNGQAVDFAARKMVATMPANEIMIKYGDIEERPVYIVFISEKQIVFEDILHNRMETYDFSDKSVLAIDEYVRSVFYKANRAYDLYYCSTPKGNLTCAITAFWNGRELKIYPWDEADAVEEGILNGDGVLDGIITFLEELLTEEGIKNTVRVDAIEKL